MGSRPSEARIALDMWRAQREGAAGLQRRREARLAALVDHARSRSNFYRDRFRGVADGNHALGDLPPVSKPELMDSFDDWVTDPRVGPAGLGEGSGRRPSRDSSLTRAARLWALGTLPGYPKRAVLAAASLVCHLAPTFIEVSGESLSATTRRRAKAAFGCPIHDVFAAAEFWAIAIECEQEWLHVNSDWVILEPVGPDLNPTPPGEPSHTVLLTNLANRVQPLIRYDLGDSVLARPDPCPCGNPLPAIRVAGRCDDVLRLLAADGHAVSVLPLAIGSVADETPGLLRSQLVQSGPSEVTVRVALRPGSQADTVWAALSPNLLTWLASQGLANVRLIRSAQAPERSATSGKFRQVIGSPPTH